MNLADNDFFSPIRHITSDSDSSVDSESSNNPTSSSISIPSTKSSQKRNVLACNETKCSKETDELGSCSSESSFASKPENPNIFTPLTKRSSIQSKRDSKTLLDSNNVILKKEKGKDNVMKKERSSNSSEDHSKKQEYQQKKDTANYDTAKLNSKHAKKGSSRPTSLSLPTKESCKDNTTKDFKKKKNVAEPSKNIFKLDRQISNTKHSEKKLVDSSLKASGKRSEIPVEKSITSNSLKSEIISDSSNAKPDASSKTSSISQNVEHSNATSNIPVNSPFEISVEKMVHEIISSECDKIRQNMYAQQMSIYRELNKVKEEIKRQHSADTEHMLQIIEDLVQLNTSLKS